MTKATKDRIYYLEKRIDKLDKKISNLVGWVIVPLVLSGFAGFAGWLGRLFMDVIK